MGGVSSAAPDDGRPALDEASRPTGPQPTAGTRDAVAAGRHLIEVHDYLCADLARVRETLRQVAADPTDLGPVTDAVDQLTETLLSHFAYEERELVAPLARYGFF